MSGRPGSLYFLPQLQRSRDYLVHLPPVEIEFATGHIIEHKIANDYQEYFQCARTNLSLPYPDDWEEALNMYRTLIDVAVNGYD